MLTNWPSARRLHTAASISESLSATSIRVAALRYLMFALIAGNFALNFAHDGRYFLDFQAYTSGGAQLPFQYRILMAPVLKALAGVPLPALFSHLPDYLASKEAIAYAIVNAASLFLAMELFHRILRISFSSDSLVFWGDVLFIVSIYSLFVLNPNLNFILPYDLPAAAFAQACILLALRERWIPLACVFAVATVNRETTFIVVIFLALRFALGLSSSRRRLLLACVSLAVIWVAAKVTLYFALTGAGEGGVAQNKLLYNLVELSKPWQWPALFPLFLPLVAAVAVARRPPDPNALAWAGSYLAGFAALFLVAQVTEQRAFGDLVGYGVFSMLLVLRQQRLLLGDR